MYMGWDQELEVRGVIAAIKKETRIGASLLRLHFHDCFVNGCDGSILLDDTAKFIGEKTAAANNNSVRGFEVVDAIKAKLEKACPKVVSCADILTLAAHDSVLGGPSWKVGLGRRDSTTASRSAANNSIPGPTFSLSALISSFSAEGLSLKNLVALSGSHTIGLARCTTFRSRIYNDTATIDASFAKSLQRKCPKSGNNNKLADLDLRTPFHFDNFYYKNLVKNKGLLHSDQALYNRSSADSLVRKYATDTDAFFKDFAKGMIKMGNIKPLTGSKGQIRINCRKVNS
ncbi:hypothetical protein FEM48_Zijuj03G0114700 [Ziziphus jujuba var. spinosa]|uniref:Peroxidase n=1 Tax=Ziziphus jujuba var. spinosa TaxID=714518 RepID=A0A978VQ19_ZIZJJ|nr:hypothetical protein FEM48_Zijuj03G0114700 [Ziziphus jujuba var. spinosa]